MAKNELYKIIFINQGEIYEIFAKKVYQGDLYGFVVAEELVFGENSSLLLDPSEERLKNEFERVSRTLIPAHEVIRIDQVTSKGSAKIRALNNTKERSREPATPFNPQPK